MPRRYLRGATGVPHPALHGRRPRQRHACVLDRPGVDRQTASRNGARAVELLVHVHERRPERFAQTDAVSHAARDAARVVPVFAVRLRDACAGLRSPADDAADSGFHRDANRCERNVPRSCLALAQSRKFPRWRPTTFTRNRAQGRLSDGRIPCWPSSAASTRKIPERVRKAGRANPTAEFTRQPGSRILASTGVLGST